MHKPHKVAHFCAALLLLVYGAQAETLVLSGRFVAQFKNKASISVTLEVDVHPSAPHSISSGGNDGDIHLAGRADEVGLPLVAEIVNARKEQAALTLLKTTAEGKRLPVKGVWRIWFEHLGKEDQIQGNPVDVPDSSNPAHLFEIHPITQFGDDPVLDAFTAIPGYTAYPAHVAFPFYEKDQATISAADGSVTITSGEGKYNYAEFVIELAGAVQADGDDGLFVLANVFDTSNEEEAITRDVRRMVFVKGTEAATRVQTMSKGDRMHVLGIPRVNLSEVAEMATEQSTQTRLPYEMIIVAILKD
ncbi:MAG TPA: hypothetical protein VK302_20120 [Terriglobales bacterium]|nr:hypothetical protein [Terriglobales bacterium]